MRVRASARFGVGQCRGTREARLDVVVPPGILKEGSSIISSCSCSCSGSGSGCLCCVTSPVCDVEDVTVEVRAGRDYTEDQGQEDRRRLPLFLVVSVCERLEPGQGGGGARLMGWVRCILAVEVAWLDWTVASWG